MSATLPRDHNGSAIQVLGPISGTAQRIAVTSSDAVAAAISGSTKVVRLKATTDCHVRLNAVATNVYLMLSAGETEYLKVAGGDIIHVIRESADGVLQITEMG